MTAVHIMGTFAKDDRPNNGLEAIADLLIKDELTPVWVVGVVVPHAYTKKAGEELSPTVRLAAVEALFGDRAAEARALLDEQRRERKAGNFEGSLFDAEADAEVDAETD